MMNNKDLKVIAEGLIATMESAGNKSIGIQNEGLKITIKKDGSPVTNGDLEVNKILTEKISQLTPSIPIVSEETVDLKKKNKLNTFWLIDPIDGTKEYIAGKDEYTLNAGLVIDNLSAIGLVGVPKKKRLFYSYGKSNSYLIDQGKTIRLNCEKKTPKGKVVAVVNGMSQPAKIINLLQKYGVTNWCKLSSSYKFCVVAAGEVDIYAAVERAHEWDYAAGHAIAEHAGAIVTTLENKEFKYGKEDYKNLSLLIRRSKILKDKYHDPNNVLSGRLLNDALYLKRND
jgi:3'(2'), 5'-bisphosphate nucleotidase